MEGPIIETHALDGNGNPAGGATTGRGFSITWQDGPLVVDGERKEPNGAFVEDVIRAAIGRLRFYQTDGHQEPRGRFACRENALAITHLEEGLMWLQKRTHDREMRAVEGTHQV